MKTLETCTGGAAADVAAQPDGGISFGNTELCCPLVAERRAAAESSVNPSFIFSNCNCYWLNWKMSTDGFMTYQLKTLSHRGRK